MGPTEDHRLRHARLKEILFEASQLSAERRAAFLDSACAGDQRMREDLESLLAHLDNDTGRSDQDREPDDQPPIARPAKSER